MCASDDDNEEENQKIDDEVKILSSLGKDHLTTCMTPTS